MLRTVTQYSTFTFLGAAVILMLSFVVEKGIEQVDEMLVPCQHGTPFIQGKCRCEGTPFNGTYCSNCMCEHGVCSTEPTTPFSNSEYGCRCPTQGKRFGFLCDLCNTEDTNGTCKGKCKPEFFGAKCERTCFANLPYDNDNEVCNTMRSSGGKCNACNGHGTCEDGFCECDTNWYDNGRDECVQTCPGSPICNGHGTCKLYGNTPGCLCERGWNGKDCDIPCPGMLETGIPCNDNGICQVDFEANSATCECLDKFRGEDCSIECPGDVVSCNGHGTCDEVGVCTCQTNVKWSLPSCKCSDELTCNALGVCNDEEKCECFGNHAGKFCLECKRNWHAEDCDLYCDPYLKANHSDQLSGQFGCFGHGTCLEHNDNMYCTCNLDTTSTRNIGGAVNNYVSYYDSHMNCGECLPEYFPKEWVVQAYGLPETYTVPCEVSCTPATCNGKGTCNHDFGVPGESLCTCEKDHVDDSSFCTACEADWYPLDFSRPNHCNKYCAASGDLPDECDGTIDCIQCNGHGTCNEEGECLCTDGYTGDECQIYCTSVDGLQCGGHGTCESNEIQMLMEHEFRIEGGIPLFGCTCDPQDPVDADSRIDWDERLALGLVNGTLDPPPNPEYYGETCTNYCEKPPWQDSDECNGMGNCTIISIIENGRTTSCNRDSDCTSNTELMRQLSNDASWKSNKGPFCYKQDEIHGCERTTNDCYEILLKQRPLKMRSEDCAIDTCLDALNQEDWKAYCEDVSEKKQPPAFHSCKSVESFCPAKTIPTYCNTMLAYTDGSEVSYKLDLAYEFDKRRYPSKITEAYRSEISTLEHDEAYAAFENAPDFPVLPDAFCPEHGQRHPQINTVRENKQYLCDGVLVNSTNCTGTLEQTVSFYTPFLLQCQNSVVGYHDYMEALRNRQPGCTVVEQDKTHVFVDRSGVELIDATCRHINAQFPTCTSPEPCDFKPCSANHACENKGGLAICTTTGDLNSTCGTGVSTRLSYTSYSCDIQVPETSCPKEITFNTNLASHCLNHNPIRTHIESIGEGETKPIIEAKHIHFEFKASELVGTSTILEFSDAIAIYVRQGQVQLNEIQGLQACPIQDQQCHLNFMYETGTWYKVDLELNATHVSMTYNGNIVTKPRLSQNTINSITTVAANSVAEYRNIVSEVDIPSPFNCNYETCNLDVSYRSICSDIVRNVHYPSLLEPQHHILETCSNIHEKTRLPDSDYNTLEQMYGLDWDIYCNFYNSLQSSLVVPYTDLENYNQCREFIDPLDGQLSCIQTAIGYNWTQACSDLDHAKVPDNLKTACPNRCYNHLFDTGDFCDERLDIFETNTKVIDTCDHDWYNYCLMDAKGSLQGICSAAECSCDKEDYEGISGNSCELHCPMASDGSACAENSNMGRCGYTPKQREYLDSGKLFDPIWAIEGECKCFLSEGTRSCDIECNDCNNGTYGNILRPVFNERTISIYGLNEQGYTIDNSSDPDLVICLNSPITFVREDIGHTFRIVNESDCTGCQTGKYDVLPNSSLNGWIDVNGLESQEYYFTEVGTYFYVCTAHENMVGVIRVESCLVPRPLGQIGMCNNARGVCECLPPFTSIEYELDSDWRGNEITNIVRQYYMIEADRAIQYRLRMMQGAEQYIKYSLETISLNETTVNIISDGNSFKWNNQTDPNIILCTNVQYEFTVQERVIFTTEDDCANLGCSEGRWTQLPSSLFEVSTFNRYSFLKSGLYYFVSASNPNRVASVTASNCVGDLVYDGTQEWNDIYNRFLNTPEFFWCENKACTQGDVSLLANLDGTGSRYNYDCNKVCPGTDETTLIPCSNRGYCTAVGSCVCDKAKVLKNTDSATIEKYQIIPGVEITKVTGGSSSLETTGFRGDECAIICPGFDPVLSDMNTICNGHGICDVVGQCACEAGYIGLECQFKCPFADGSICAGHGTCEMGEIEITLDPFAPPSQTCLHYATIQACEAYAIINKHVFIDVSNADIVGENEACTKINKKKCMVWGGYQYINYTFHGEIMDETKPSGCIEVERKLYFNVFGSDISCGIMGTNCICQTDKPEITYCAIDGPNIIAHVKGGEAYTQLQGKYEGLSYNFKYREMFQGQCISTETFVSHAVDKKCSTTHKIDVGDNLDEVDLETCKIYCLSNKNCAFFDYDGTNCNMYTQCTLEDRYGTTVYQEFETNLKFDNEQNTGSVDEKVYKCYKECQTHVGFIIDTGTGKCLCEDATSDCTQALNDYVRYDIGQVDYQHAKQLCDSQPCMGLQEDPPGSGEWYAMERTDVIKTGSVISYNSRDQCENGKFLGSIPDSLTFEEQEQICAAMCAGDDGCNFFTMGGSPYEFRESNGASCQIQLSERECTFLANTEMLEGVAITYNNGCRHGSAPICRTVTDGVVPCYAHSFCSKRDLNRVQDGLNWNSKTSSDCETYAGNTLGFTWQGDISDSSKPYGCILTTSNNFINYNTQKSTTKCSNTIACMQYDNLKTDFVTSMSYTRDECEAYMTENGFVLGTSIINRPHPGPGICEDARFVAHEDTADACSMRCVHDPTCAAFSFNGSTCYLSNGCTTRPWNGYSYDLTEYRRHRTCKVTLSYNTRLEDCSRLSDRRIDTDCTGCKILCSDDSKCRGYTCEHTCVLIEREIDTCVTGPTTFFKDMIYMGEINSSDVSSGCIIDEHRRVYENVDINTVACGDVKNLTVTTHVPEANHKQKPGMCIEDVEKWGWGELPRRGYEAGAWRLIKPGYNLGQNYEEYTVDDVWECLYQKCKGKYASHNSDWSANQCRCGYTLRDPSVRAEAKTYERMRPDSEEGCISMCEETPECVASSFDMMEYRIKDTNVPLLMGDGYAAGERDRVVGETLEACRIRCQNDADCMGYSYNPQSIGYIKIFDGECENTDAQFSPGTLTLAGCSSACFEANAIGFIVSDTVNSAGVRNCYCEFVDSATCSRSLGTTWDRYDIATLPACFLTSTQPQLPLTGSSPWVTYSMGKRTLRKVHLQDKEFTFTSYVTPRNEGEWSSYVSATQIFSGIPTTSLTETQCEQYATDTDGVTWKGAITQDYRPKGCIQLNTNQIWFNQDSASTTGCGATSSHVACIVSGPCENQNLKRDGYEYKYTTECKRRQRDAGWLIGRHTSGVGTGFALFFNGGHLTFSPYNMLDYISKIDYRSPCVRQNFEYEADGHCADERDKIQHHAVTHQECEERCADDNDCVAFSFFDNGTPSCSLSSACMDINTGSGIQAINFGAPDGSVSETECQSYATAQGQTFVSGPWVGISAGEPPSGCSIKLYASEGIFYNTRNNARDCTFRTDRFDCLKIVQAGSKTYRVDAKYSGYGKELTGNPLPKDVTTKVTLKRGHAGRHLKDRNGHCSDSSLYNSGGWELMEPTERYVGKKCDGGVQKLYGNGDNDGHVSWQYKKCYKMCSNYSSFSLKDNGECWCHEFAARSCATSGLQQINSGASDNTVSAAECEAYANSIGEFYGGSGTWSGTTAGNPPYGCSIELDANGGVYHNIYNNGKSCSDSDYTCVQSATGWTVYQIDGSYEDMYNTFVDRAFDYCMDNYPTTKFVSVWRDAGFRCYDTCNGRTSDSRTVTYSKAGLPALHLYYNDTLECTATFTDMSDLPGQVSPDTLQFGSGLLGTMENTTLTMPKCVHSKKCNMKIGHPIDYEHHCYSTDSADITSSAYSANLEQCIQTGLDTGARYVSYAQDGNGWCIATKVCEEKHKYFNDNYFIYDLHQLNGTTTMKEPKEIKRFSGQDGDKGLISNNPTGGPNNYINNKQTYGGYSEFVKAANGGTPRNNKGDIMNNHFLGNGYCEDAYRVYVGKYTFDDCWSKCKGETKCTAFSFGQYGQHLPTCALSTMCRGISKQQIKSKAQCQEMAIKANEAFLVLGDNTMPSGCYYKDQYVWNTDENINYFEDYVGEWVKLPIGDDYILGSGYGSYTSVTSQEECITTCEENGYSLSSFATNGVKCRCGHVGTDHEWYTYVYGMGVYMLGGTRPATLNNAKSWSIHPVQESVDPQLPNTTYDGEGKCLEGYDKIDSRYMTVGTCAVQCGKDPKCDSFSFSTWGGHEFESWGYPNNYMKMYDGRGTSWNTNEGTWDEVFDNCFEACATEKRDKNSKWHNHFYDSVSVYTNPLYKGGCYCANAWRYSPATDYVLSTTYATHRIVPSCILSTTCSRGTDTFGWNSYKVKRVKKQCKEGTIQINEKCYDKVARHADHFSDGLVTHCVLGDCDSVSNQCTSEGGRLAQKHEYDAWITYMNKMGKDGRISSGGLTDKWVGGKQALHGYSGYNLNYCCSKPNYRWFLCITEMEEVIDKIVNKVSEGVLKHSYVIVNATKETCVDACTKPKYQYAFKGECNGGENVHPGLTGTPQERTDKCYDMCKSEGAKTMVVTLSGTCICELGDVDTCMRVKRGFDRHAYTLNEYETVYASYGSECRCSNTSSSIQTNAQVTQAGLGDFSVSEAECEAFAVAHTNLEYQLFEASTFPNSPTGCFMETRISSSNVMSYYYYNRAETNITCAINGDLMGCIKTNVTDMHMFKVSHANWTENGPMPSFTYYVSRSGYSDTSMEECEAYSSMETGSWSDRPHGCVHSGGVTYWNTHDTGLTCATFPCVKRLEMDSYLMDVPEAGRSYSKVHTGTEFNFGNSLIHSHWAWLDL